MFSLRYENGYVKGYEWIWIMDYDAEPRKKFKNTTRGYLSFENVFPTISETIARGKIFFNTSSRESLSRLLLVP